jgi:mycothiol synthase
MSLQVRDRLTGPVVAQVRDLVAAGTAADGRSPLSDDTLAALARPGGRSRHILVQAGPDLVGYGSLVPVDGPRPMLAELAVHPGARGRGVGRKILAALSGLAGPGGFTIWAHGIDEAGARWARQAGYTRERVLLLLRRPLTDPVPAPSWPPGVRVRTFEPGADEDAWLAANRAAFTELPDQGSWRPADLQARMQEPWFDPAGFFLALDDDAEEVLGFHWTKRHPCPSCDGPGVDGEVYVLGIVPAARGRGLAQSLALVGLHHLQGAGATTAHLYVDAANTAAVRLYEGLGFAVSESDVLYSAPDSAQIVGVQGQP